ncbi:MAG: FtsW/RodA/SpoVE family cell cycle protein [Oscillospiraceae bacterium]|nr:FtsW/RodA/SpoVE family cell cycle protein [Oscillospiraceae bacterium]
MEELLQYTLDASKYVMIIMSVLIIVRCIRSMLSERIEPEVWAYFRLDDELIPVCHWENLVGRSRSCDVRIARHGVGKIHAVLTRNDRGIWKLFNVFSAEDVWVNGQKAGTKGIKVEHGDLINLGGFCLYFVDISSKQRNELEEGRTSAGHSVSPAVTLFELTVFQLLLILQHAISAQGANVKPIAMGFIGIIALQWCCFNIMRLMNRSGFEPEILAFYLSTLGMSVAASSTPDDIFKQILLLYASVALFLLLGWWMRNLKRSTAMRIPMGILALGLMAVNIVTADAVFGARNWLEIGGFSFQPSELVKVFYVYAGASTLDRLYRGRNLISFIIFSAVCVIALALIGDFGTALIFFICFLVISFMRSGSIATVFLALSGAGLAGFLALSVKPYIAQRFATWGHVWEDVYDKGFQQTRAMSAAASGGLFGKGAGGGWLKDIFAANTDMVFAVICEEQGLIIALCMVLAVLTLAFFAVRSVRNGRSAYYAIAACATMSMMLTQLGLNVFGSLDILPFTGVTFPFVSRGGSSLLSCWMMLAFLKCADNRRDASFAVRSVKKIKNKVRDDEFEENEFLDYDENEELFEERFYQYDPEFTPSDDDGEWEEFRP